MGSGRRSSGTERASGQLMHLQTTSSVQAPMTAIEAEGRDDSTHPLIDEALAFKATKNSDLVVPRKVRGGCELSYLALHLPGRGQEWP